MKRILSILTLLLVSLSICAYDFMVNGIAFNNIGDNEVEVTKNETKEYSGNITIPEKVEYKGKVYKVVSIGEGAFYGCENLTSITIPNSITSIGNEAFQFCYGLVSINLPNNVTNIGESAFSCCSSLTSITMPNNITSIGSLCFYSCNNLKSIEIPNSVTTIGRAAFANSGLTSITLPNAITAIEETVFYECKNLKSIEIPNSVTTIGRGAFANCGLTSLTIPNSVTYIDGYAFESCERLLSITLPNDITSIEDYTFCYCTSLISVNIPNTVNTIGSNSFAHCEQLASITLSDNLTSIGDYAFNFCLKLISITLPINVTSIGIGAFRSTRLSTVESLNTVPPTLCDKAFCYIVDGYDSDYCPILYVPKGCKTIYGQDTEWAKFKDIVEMEASDNGDDENQDTTDDNQGSETSKSPLLTIHYDNGTDAKYKMDDISSISITPKQNSSEDGSAVKLEYGGTKMTLSLGQKPQIVNEGDNIILKTSSMTVTLSVPCKATFVGVSDTSIDKVVLRNNEEDKPIDVFTIDGRKVTTLKGKNETFSLEKGVYIINGKKMIIK